MDQCRQPGDDGLQDLCCSSLLQIDIICQLPTDLLYDGQEKGVVVAFEESVEDRVDDQVRSQLELGEVSERR